MDLLELRAEGIYCAAGDFYIDPWEAVERAVVTSAGRARPGSRAYLTARSGARLVRERLGAGAPVESAEYGERMAMGDAAVSLHPAGHMLGSAQVRMERGGEVWVFAGDFRPAADATRERFEPLRCHTLLTGAAFGLPIFRWPTESETIAAIHEWWRGNREAGKTSVLYAAPLGQAQRVLARLDGLVGAVWLHPEVERVCAIYRAEGIDLPAGGDERSATLKIAPPGSTPAGRTPGRPGTRAERGARISTAMVSGWMRIRGTRRRRSLDRGFVLSGQADWTELLARHRCHGRGNGLGDARVPGAAGALAGGAWAAGAHHGRAVRGGGRVKAFAELYAALDETTKTNEKVAALERYFRDGRAGGRRVGGELPDGAASQAAAGIAQAGAVGHGGGGGAGLAVRRVLPRGGRFRGDHRAAAAGGGAIHGPAAALLGGGAAAADARSR